MSALKNTTQFALSYHINQLLWLADAGKTTPAQNEMIEQYFADRPEEAQEAKKIDAPYGVIRTFAYDA